jgi:hypothetical protein
MSEVASQGMAGQLGHFIAHQWNTVEGIREVGVQFVKILDPYGFQEWDESGLPDPPLPAS